MDYKLASDKEIIEEAKRRWTRRRIVDIASPTKILKSNMLNVWYTRGLSKQARARLEAALAESEIISAAAVMGELRQLRTLLERLIELTETRPTQSAEEEAS